MIRLVKQLGFSSLAILRQKGKTWSVFSGYVSPKSPATERLCLPENNILSKRTTLLCLYTKISDRCKRNSRFFHL
jgi:hypothetical protein